ncbi:hypothetical protein HHI36_009652 [Cryptolaemus montrouzieri]|uniref:Uncharacterized protein n=1 Tax=Cryptolaemus montrouzieri TaxID=559131 RepID=A0ABD2MGG6_9CUCU
MKNRAQCNLSPREIRQLATKLSGTLLAEQAERMENKRGKFAFCKDQKTRYTFQFNTKYKCLVTILAVFCSKAYPEYHHERGHSLQAIPDLESYGKIQYPHFDIIELGSYQKGDIPPKVIHITKKIVIKQPHPYPVKVPHPVPYPVPHKVPYPVVHTKVETVAQPVPYPVIKTVQVPVEVPKPYPVPVHDYKAPDGGQTAYGGGTSGSGQEHHDFSNFGQGDQQEYGEQNSYPQTSDTYGVPGHEPGQPLGLDGYSNQGSNGDGYSSQHEESQQSINYAAFQVTQNEYQAEGEKPVQEGQQETEKQ